MIPHALERRACQPIGTGKEPRQAVAEIDRLAKRGRDAARKRRRRFDGDLLAENRANGDLESVPGARCPNPRMPCEYRRQQRIAAEMLGNHRRIGVEVEDAPDAFDDGEQRTRIGEANAECQRASFRGVRHLDRAHVSVQRQSYVGSTRDRPVRHPASRAVRETPASDPSRTADGR